MMKLIVTFRNFGNAPKILVVNFINITLFVTSFTDTNITVRSLVHSASLNHMVRYLWFLNVI
jgi:hypothetical protein